MKHILIVLGMLSLSASLLAQDEEEKTHKFRRDNIFIGGAIGLGLSSGGFSAGANPEIGYSIANWLDAGISTNFDYYSINAEYNAGFRDRSFTKGAGVFVRVFPFKGFFLQVLPEFNTTTVNRKDVNYYGTGEEIRLKVEAPSLLLGIGYGNRVIGNLSYYTILMIDAGNNVNSPYIDYSGGKLPILRTGFNFYLRPRRK